MGLRERAAHGLCCPACREVGSLRVIDVALIDLGIRRRRECLSCRARFTSYEILEPSESLGVRADRLAVNL